MSFLKNAWYVAAWSENLRIDEPEERTILGETLVIYRSSLGVVTVLNNRCPHRFAPLHMGKVCANGNLRCGYHGLEFDSSGKCSKNPYGHTASALRVRSYASLERYGAVWVWMGDRPADETAMPDLRVLEEAPSQDVTYRDSVRMQAHYELVMNNLMDLSHVPFLHSGLLGNDDTVAAEVKVLQENDTVTVTRYMQSVVPAPFFEMLFRGNGTLVDNWNSITWIAPTCMINDNGVTLPGTPKAQGTGVSGLHLLTPETDRSTMYYFVAVRQNPLPFPEPVRQDIMAKLKSMRRFAFVTQDGPIIEGQQRLMDSAGPDELSACNVAITSAIKHEGFGMHINGHRDNAADEDHVISARVARVFLTLQHCVDPCEARNTVDAHLTRDIRPLILGAAGKAARQFRLVRCKYVYDKPGTRLKRRNNSAIAP